MAEERADRFYLRAIPNLFGTVNRARENGYLLNDEKVFSEVYAWYWVNIIEARQLSENPMFCRHTWMATEADIEKARVSRSARLNELNKVRKDSS